MYRTVDTEANSIIGSDNPSFARPVEVEPISWNWAGFVFLLLLCLLSMSHVLNSTGFSLGLGWELVFSMFCFSLKTSLWVCASERVSPCSCPFPNSRLGVSPCSCPFPNRLLLLVVIWYLQGGWGWWREARGTFCHSASVSALVFVFLFSGVWFFLVILPTLPPTSLR